MARFYDTGVFSLPGWALDILYKCISPLKADEATWQANAARTARLSGKDYEKQMKRWQEQGKPVMVVDTAITVDPKWADWFAANGIEHRVKVEGGN